MHINEQFIQFIPPSLEPFVLQISLNFLSLSVSTQSFANHLSFSQIRLDLQCSFIAICQDVFVEQLQLARLHSLAKPW